MGENLSLDDRDAIRTPMQWDDGPNGGFSGAPGRRLTRPQPDGLFGPEHVNAASQRQDPGSLWSYIRQLIRRYRQMPQIGWSEVEVLDSSGKHLATHPRAYGQASTNSEDPSMQLALLCNKPASWPNSRVRDALPDPLREWLDRQDRQTRNEALQTLKRVDRESGWANAVEAMLSILESTGGADRAGVTLLAARLAEGVAGIEYDDDRPDLSEYDIAFTADVGVQEGGR